MEVRTLDGLNGPLEARGFVPGVNVVVGPNASGKSSLVRALRAALYPDGEEGLVEVRLGLVGDDGSPLVAHRLADQVRWARAGREATRPPLPPREVLGAYVFELEDLTAGRGDGPRRSDTVDDHIASRLQLELTGGVDLAAMRRRLPGPPNAGRAAAGELRRAEQALAELRRERLRLGEQEARLGEDERRLEELNRRAARAGAVRTAHDLADAVAAAARAEARLRELPPELAELLRTDVDAVEELARELREALAEAAHLRRQLAEAERAAADARLPAWLTAEAAHEERELAEELRRLEGLVAENAAELAGARAAAAETWRAMGGAPGHGGAESVDRATIDAAAAAAFVAQEAAREEASLLGALREVQGRLEALGSGDRGDASFEASVTDETRGEDVPARAARPEGARAVEERVPALRRAAHDLTRWLELPPPAPSVPAWSWGVSLALAVAAVGAALLLPAPWPAAAAGALLAWLLFAFAASRRQRAPERDAAAVALRRALDAVGLRPPEELTHEAVADLLGIVTEAASAAERRREARKELEDSADRLGAALAQARRRRQEAAERLAALREAHGLSAPGDAGFVQWLALAREHALALVRVRELEARQEELEGGRAAACSRVVAHLAAVGAAARAEDPAPVLLERCRRVCEAVAARDAAAARVDALGRDIAEEASKAGSAAKRLSSLAARLGYRGPAEAEGWTPESVDGLRRHVAALARLKPEREAALKEHADAEARAALCRSALAHDPELRAAAEAGDREAIAAVEREADAARDRARLLGEAIGALKDRVERAGRERSLERAVAAARRARDVLEAHREARMEQAAAAFLLDDVEAEHEAVTKPAALERAKEWFGRVTHGDFELTFEPAEGGWRFGAVDRRADGGGRRLRLEELSTGTRAQLLISARLAYALTLEEAGGAAALETLPFVLDEALTTSDPSRFAQVAGAVLDIVEASGRQFVYLSARPEDADLWRRAAASRPRAPLAVIALAGSAVPAEGAAV